MDVAPRHAGVDDAARSRGGAGIATALALLRRVNEVVDRAVGIGLIAFAMGIFALIVVSVFWRYVLNNALSWSEEIAKYGLVWMTFLGASSVMIRRGHMAIEFLPDRLAGTARVLVVVVADLVVVATLVLLLWQGTVLTLRASTQFSPVIPWLSISAIYASMPLSAFLMLLISVEHLLRDLVSGFAKPS